MAKGFADYGASEVGFYAENSRTAGFTFYCNTYSNVGAALTFYGPQTTSDTTVSLKTRFNSLGNLERVRLQTQTITAGLTLANSMPDNLILPVVTTFTLPDDPYSDGLWIREFTLKPTAAAVLTTGATINCRNLSTDAAQSVTSYTLKPYHEYKLRCNQSSYDLFD